MHPSERMYCWQSDRLHIRPSAWSILQQAHLRGRCATLDESSRWRITSGHGQHLKHWVDKCIFCKPENTLTFVGPGSWSPRQFGQSQWGMHFSVCQESMRFDLLRVRNMGITAKRYMAQKWPYKCILSKPENASTCVVPNSWGGYAKWVLARECWSI